LTEKDATSSSSRLKRSGSLSKRLCFFNAFLKLANKKIILTIWKITLKLISPF